MKDLIVINKEYIKTKRLRKVASDKVRERKKAGCLLLNLKASINGKAYRLIRDRELKPILFLIKNFTFHFAY